MRTPGVPGLQVVVSLPELCDVVLCKSTRFYEIKQNRAGRGGKRNELKGSTEGEGRRGCGVWKKRLLTDAGLVK